MRPPPAQSAALQQNEVSQRQRTPHTQQQQSLLHLHSQQLQQQQPQQQSHSIHLNAQTTSLNRNHSNNVAAAVPHAYSRKYRFEQHDFSIEKPLNFVAATAQQQCGTATIATTTATAPKVPARHIYANTPPYQTSESQSQSQSQSLQTSYDCLQLLDFSTSAPTRPPVVPSYVANTYRRASVVSAPPPQRSSLISQYSRSSSSEDASSIGGSCGERLQQQQQQQRDNYDRANTFDDAAEHFIINFPADSPTHNPHDCPINLPLSETEPLLTNIEATVADTQRAIRLHKNSASLIFTKKELPQRSTYNNSSTAAAAANPNNNCAKKRNNSQQQQQQHKQPLQHSFSLRAANDYNRAKQSKHLPATYQLQQQRRSLQLNYNNNLVTTSTCNANNNYCNSRGNNSSCNSNNGVGVVLHKHHHVGGALKSPVQVPVPVSASAAAAAATTTSPSNTNTAAATRKQHAYSWYAPVYSALEEELEQDSRDSSPIHNLANTKKQHSNHHYQHRSGHTGTTAATDNETVALLETRNQINIQAQLHAQLHQSKESVNAGVRAGQHKYGGGQTKRPQQQSNGYQQSPKAPTSLPLTNAHNATLRSGPNGMGGGSAGDSFAFGGNHATSSSTAADADRIAGVAPTLNGYDADGTHVNSLSGALPPRRRIENFLKSLVGLKSSSSRNSSNNSSSNGLLPPVDTVATVTSMASSNKMAPTSPEITITRTPSEQNLVIIRDATVKSRQHQQQQPLIPTRRKSSEKLSSMSGALQGSTSSLNVVQQKLWNIMRREGSAASLYNEPKASQSAIVQYRGLRKCETVLALTRQTGSLCSPLYNGGSGGGGSNGGLNHSAHSGMRRTHTTGSGIFSASGVEQIRPLNRLRHSVNGINNAATCSRCSSLLSLAASGSRYSLHMAPAARGGVSNGVGGNIFASTAISQQHLQGYGYEFGKPPPHSSQHHQQQREIQQQYRKISNVSTSNLVSNNLEGSSSRCRVDDAVNSEISGNSGSGSVSGNCSRKSSAQSTSSTTPPSNLTTATLNFSITSSMCATTPTTPTAVASSFNNIAPVTAAATPTTTPTPTASAPLSATQLCTASTSTSNTSGILIDLPTTSPTATTPSIGGSGGGVGVGSASPLSAPNSPPTYSALPTTSQTYPFTITSLLSMPTVEDEDEQRYDDVAAAMASSGNRGSIHTDGRLRSASASAATGVAYMLAQQSSAATAPTTAAEIIHPQQQALLTSSAATAGVAVVVPFQSFTCKLCLVDVETAAEATTLQQCGCQFCTECMKAYVDFEIMEGAYEISCPDAQCPTQGIMTLPEIANLTSANAMKKHHRYRLNKEIEMDKTRTWCPRAGCETVCHIGVAPHYDATPSTSNALAASATADGIAAPAHQQPLCAVQCPSCKDEFCSACKKAWHPNMTCEENSRRLVADGQDDIGIPFDNDLIKCCPMCAVPIEKDEGCAQMMCKRCKHVFCWYCLASLDDDFLLRHYDRGPCKNKLGHSRASVVWHRAQVIGIFAGFGILLLVASPLLLLAAPCIICCKCRSCGSRIDEVDAELEEGTALQSSS